MKRMFPKLLLLFGSIIFMVVLLEIVFRIAGVHGDYRQPRVDTVIPIAGLPNERVPYGFITNSIVISRYDSNPRGYFEEGNTIRHEHNSAGWRSDEHEVEKDADTFRILGLGDSYLWGQGVKYEDICLTKLGGLLEESLPGDQVETINAGISGYNTVMQRDQLVEEGLAYDPDLIVLHFVLNDVEHKYRKGPKIEFFGDYTNIYQSPDWLSNWSNVWGWGRHRVLKHFQAKQYLAQCVDSFQVDGEGWRTSRDALKDIQNICEEKGIPFCVVIFPFFTGLDGDYPFEVIHRTVREYCEAQGIPVLDTRNAFRGFIGPELWVHPTDQHPNEIAHDIAAGAIAEFIKGRSDELLARGLR